MLDSWWFNHQMTFGLRVILTIPQIPPEHFMAATTFVSKASPPLPYFGQRHMVLLMVCILSMITYLDRAAFPNASRQIQDALGLKDIADLKLALTAFNLAYALFEIPTGMLGDLFGPRLTLIRIVLWWSFFTAMTALVGFTVAGVTLVNFGVLVAIRFLFGIGEAGAYPNITRALYNWLPLSERGWAQGLVWTSARIMGGLTPFLWLVFVTKAGIDWRIVFLGFGLLGVVWCFVFSRTFRNLPSEDPNITTAELEYIAKGRTGGTGHAKLDKNLLRMLYHPNTLLLCAMYFCQNFGWYFNLNYLPSIMTDHFDVPSGDWLGALFKGGPLLLGAVGCYLGGWITDRMVRRSGRKTAARCVPGVIGSFLAGVSYLGCLWSLQNNNVVCFALFIALTGFFNDLTMAPTWATVQDVGGKISAIVAGTMNMIGNLGGAIVTFLTGSILTQGKVTYAAANGLELANMAKEDIREAFYSGYQTNIMMFAGVYFLSSIIWIFIRAENPVPGSGLETNPPEAEEKPL